MADKSPIRNATVSAPGSPTTTTVVTTTPDPLLTTAGTSTTTSAAALTTVTSSSTARARMSTTVSHATSASLRTPVSDDNLYMINSRNGHKSHISAKKKEFLKLAAEPQITLNIGLKVSQIIRSVENQSEKIKTLDKKILEIRTSSEISNEIVSIANYEEETEELLGAMTSVMEIFAQEFPLSALSKKYTINSTTTSKSTSRARSQSCNSVKSNSPTRQRNNSHTQRTSTPTNHIPPTIPPNSPSDSPSPTNSPNRHQNTRQNLSARTHEQIKMYKVDPPSFSGNYMDFISFEEQFNAAVHNNTTLGGAQKFSYLLQSVKGEAKQLIEKLAPTSANYRYAREILTERFGDREVIEKAHFDALFEIPPAKEDTTTAIRFLVNTFSSNLAGLEQLKHKTKNWDSMLLYLLSKKLARETQKQWDLAKIDGRTYRKLIDFLKRRAKSLEGHDIVQKQQSTNQNNNSGQYNRSRFNQQTGTHQHVYTAANVQPEQNEYADQEAAANEQVSETQMYYQQRNQQCSICKEQHSIFQCQRFRNQDYKAKKETIVQLKLCWNCLTPNHLVKQCPSKNSCRTCKKRHHTLMHPYDDAIVPPPPGNTNSNIYFSASRANRTNAMHQGNDALANNANSETQSTGILATARITVKDKKGNNITLRALFDSGAQSNFITAKACNKLGITPSGYKTIVNGLGDNNTQTTTGSVTIDLLGKNEKINAELHVLPVLTSNLPNEKVNIRRLADTLPRSLADIQFHVPAPIDILAGVSIYNKATTGRKKQIGSLTAWETIFGWTISGPHIASEHNATQSFPITEPWDLTKFWTTEELPEGKRMRTNEEIQAEAHYSETTKYNDQGLAIVELPFKTDAKPLGHIRGQAIKRFLNQEKRLAANPDVSKDYKEFMKGFIDLGHLEKMSDTEVRQLADDKSYYLCHSAVFKESTTTPLRVVFDGGAKTSTGTSLNDNLLTGPQLQSTLYDILLRMRFHRFCAAGDISKMFRMLLLAQKHQNYHLVIWRDNEFAKLDTYKMTRVTYGLTSSTYLAVRTLQDLAKNAPKELADIIERDFYVDDLITGANTEAELSTIIEKLSTLLISRGLLIRKWVCNAMKIIARMKAELRENATAYTIQDQDHNVKALGLQWYPGPDHYSFAMQHINDKPINTKRELVSDVGQVFDPTGLISPVVIKCKMLLQTTWQRGTGWDDKLPEDVKEDFENWRQDMTKLKQIKINRCVLPKGRIIDYQLHVFADASRLAFGACVYARVEDDQGFIETNLITSKTKVAPIKTLSIPRLELQAATMGSKLAKSAFHAVSQLNIGLKTPQGWTDSTIVLAWIAGTSGKWSTFVGNRVAEIQNNIPPENWKHVKTDQNPADLASRSATSDELMQSSLWWKGPDFLKQPTSELMKTGTEEHTTDKELRKSTTAMNATTHAITPNQETICVTRFSKLRALVRTLCMVRRAITQFKLGKARKTTGFEIISAVEEKEAFEIVVRQEQQKYFSEEIALLNNKKQVDKKSKLNALYPFIDNNILKVGGRLAQGDATEEAKYQMIIPKESPLSNLIITDIHKRMFHAGTQTCLGELRQNMWIPGARNLIRLSIRKCVTCHRYHTSPQEQLMGDLPAARVSAHPPFEHAGLDFAGPFGIIDGGVHKKAYMALWVCFSTKAIHLEVVSDLTAGACCAAFYRMTCKRGTPKQMYSDNGTNFVGTRNELNKIREILSTTYSEDSLAALATKLGTSWAHIPPRSPHFGGLWEAGVKAAKSLLRKVMGKAVLTYEELDTVFCQIMQILNSRPLVEISHDSQDLNAITPNMILLSKRSSTLPILPYEKMPLPMHPARRWKAIQNFVADFWMRWKKEYLPTLQTRSKWTNEKPNVQVGDLVLVVDENTPPLVWPLARIMETFTGNDTLVRTVKIRTKAGEYVRPITKIRKLPIEPLTAEELEPIRKVNQSFH